MTLIRWTPARPSNDVLSLRSDLDRFIDSFFTPSVGHEAALLAPAVDVEETTEAFVFRADLPGLDAKDVKVSLHGEVLTIRGERRRANEKTEGNAHRLERAFGSFERSFTLRSAVRSDQVKASYRDGVLEVVVPKADEARLREIEVQVG